MWKINSSFYKISDVLVTASLLVERQMVPAHASLEDNGGWIR